MRPTGQVYLQVFDTNTNQFKESRNIVSFVSRPTGLFLGNETYLFSGIQFNSPIKINQIEMMPINIGIQNISGSGMYSLNLGMNCADIFTDSALITGGFLGAHNIGYFNTSNNAIHVYNLGYFNSTTNKSTRSLNLGGYNYSSGSLDTYNLGKSNISQTGINTFLIGYNNNIYSGIDFVLFGRNNLYVKSPRNSTVIGNTNNIKDLASSKLYGNTNIVSGSLNLDVFGNDGFFTYSDGLLVLGNTNQINSSQNSSYFGSDNSSSKGFNNFNVGDSNLLNGTGNNIFGDYNSILGVNDTIYGAYNSAETNSINDFVAGDSNYLSGTNTTHIFGDSNNLGPLAIQLIYQSAITGLTGLNPGEQIGTGVIGYQILGGYSGVTGIGGFNNFLVGNANIGSLNNNLYLFGSDNSLLGNNGSYILGKDNYLENSTSCYVFGETNSISGQQNLVIGNNNTIRSGDYNSILIGISHEFTGQDKIASITLASVDNSLEISPSNIEIKSANRPKINNENIIVNSDLGNYLNISNGLSNSGVYDSFIINDPSYNNLSAQIELKAFVYSGTTEKYYGEFSGDRVSAFDNSILNTYYNNKPFVKSNIANYPGYYTSPADYYYPTTDNNFYMIFALSDIEATTGCWIISTTDNAKLFYNRSTNTGVVPLIDWLTYTDVGFIASVSGYLPAPELTYIPSDSTGIYQKQKINSVTNLLLDDFNIFGTQSYATDEIAVIYGNHTDPKFLPAWLIVDKYSSGLYYINQTTDFNVTPQYGWVSTGYMGFTGGIPNYATLGPVINNTGIKISLGTRSGIISSYDPTLGKIYIPFYY